jgi:hypothetical protein
MIYLPALVLPTEFVTCLKDSNYQTGNSGLFSYLRQSPGLLMVLERAFDEFNEHQIGLEKIVTTLGWEHFRDRMCSVYLFKILNSSFPEKTDLELVEEIKSVEKRFSDRSLAGNSRLFLLGFYLKVFNLYESFQENPKDPTKIPMTVDRALALSKARTDKPDWLILLCWHMDQFLGSQKLTDAIKAGESWDKLYEQLTSAQKFHLISNLLSYGASIEEDDPFLYERI